jgi:hypothetical protein
MPLTFDMKIAYGEMVVRKTDNSEKHDFKIKIVGGNCLAVWIYETKESYNLFFFLCDKKHGMRVIDARKDKTLLGKWKKDVMKIRLNMYYKDTCQKLLDLFMKSGYEVTCYYKEP